MRSSSSESGSSELRVRRAGDLDLSDEVGDVEPPMHRRVGAEPPRRLLELALAPDAVAALGLVPGDGHVHEALEEVALGRLGGAPDVLEDLVRGEVLAALDQLEPALEVVTPVVTPIGGGWWGSYLDLRLRP